MDPPRRDLLAGEVADAIAANLTPILDALMAALSAEVPLAGFTPDEQERIREGLRQLCLGFVRYLRLGDLEANQCERLRDLLSISIPGLPVGSVDELSRSLRMDALDILGRVLPQPLSDEERRLLDHELEAYLGLLRPGEVRLHTIGELDTWLSRIAASGRDIGPSPAT